MQPWRWLDPGKLDKNSHRILVASNPAIVAGAECLEGCGGMMEGPQRKRFLAHIQTYCKRIGIHHLLLKNKGYSISTKDQASTKTHQHDEVPKFLFSLIPLSKAAMTSFHKFSLRPGWMEHETWQVTRYRSSQRNRLEFGTQCGRSTSESSQKMGPDLFQNMVGSVW